MGGFSNEFMASLTVQRIGNSRIVTCPKCEVRLSESRPGDSVTDRDHADMLRHFKTCPGKPAGGKTTKADK
jgi:hypothetical protein